MKHTLIHLLTPHQSNNHRARLLQPTGLGVLVGIFSLFQIWMTSSLSIFFLPEGMVLGFASSIHAEEVVSLTNSERSALGLEPLQFNNALSEAARLKALHMFEHDYWAHIAPDGTTPWQFIRGAGYQYSVAGENLARDFQSTQPMIKAWMASPTHRDNIINQRYTDIGVAVVDGKLEGVETTLVVQMFGNLTTAVAAAPETQAAIPDPPVETTQEQAPIVDSTQETIPISETGSAEELGHQPPSDPTSLANIPLVQSTTLGEASRLQLTSTPIANRISPLFLTKVLASSLVLLLLTLLLYDALVIHHYKVPRIVGRTFAHLSFFGLVILMMALASPGIIK